MGKVGGGEMESRVGGTYMGRPTQVAGRVGDTYQALVDAKVVRPK
jgi:hypothetical protein